MATIPDGAVQAFADVARFASLDANGFPATGLSVYVSKQPIKVTLTPAVETGDDLVTKNAGGDLAAHYKHGDVLKYYTVQYEHASPDPQLAFMLQGGALLTDNTTALITPASVTATPSITGGALPAASYSYRVSAYNANGETLAAASVAGTVASGVAGSVALSWTAVAGALGYAVYGRTAGRELQLATVLTNSYTDTGAAVPFGALPLANTTAGEGVTGYQAPALGAVSNPNGVSIELWCKAIINGQQATDKPYYRWVIPRCTNFHVDARDFTNAVLQNVYVGDCYENANWGSGPMADWRWDSSKVYQFDREGLDAVPAQTGFTPIPATA